MDKEIFDYSDYREYLLAWIASRPNKGRGLRVSIAETIHSPVSHVSQVLKGISNLSFEQAEGLNELLGHSTEQADYFLLLVQLQRAGTPKLRARLKTQIEKARAKRLVLKDRLGVKSELSREDQVIFYSSWHYVAVHILLTIPEFQTKEKIARHLKLSLKRVTEILEFMMNLGLAELKNGKYIVGTTRIHLGNDSAMITKHHINWRLQAIQSLEREDFLDSLHYSSVVSISCEDVTQIKSVLVKAIENAKNLIRDSKEEELHSFCIDFFRV
ncbi:MAG: TIGR02147 family protein [Xanthomonadaceae bacterium]|nr:TIGR02147 family protein [Xanthomonadaceae bacterium]